MMGRGVMRRDELGVMIGDGNHAYAYSDSVESEQRCAR